MENLKIILTEISTLTNWIREYYPELYASLEENKMSMEKTEKKVTDDEFADYLATIKEKLEHYLENHKRTKITTSYEKVQ